MIVMDGVTQFMNDYVFNTSFCGAILLLKYPCKITRVIVAAIQCHRGNAVGEVLQQLLRFFKPQHPYKLVG